MAPSPSGRPLAAAKMRRKIVALRFAGTIYSAGQTEGLPEDAVLAAAGCGNPIALGSLREGGNRR